MITNIKQLDLSKKYTYADYMTWRLKERVELIKGYVFKMSPAPNLNHQRIVGDIFLELGSFLRNKKCQVFIAPFDVRLPIPSKKTKKPNTVVQPDITVICDSNKLDEQGCNGSPDLVIEILSPGNTKKEMKDKFNIYEESGVLEYWLVYPSEEFIIVYTLNKEKNYIGSPPYLAGDTIKSKAVKGFKLKVNKIFK